MLTGEKEPRRSLSPPLFTLDPRASACTGTFFHDRGQVLGPDHSIPGLGGHVVQHAQTLWSLVATSGFFPLPYHLPSQGLKNH